jgi:tetratricopeptide (TPR) repeat protein
MSSAETTVTQDSTSVDSRIKAAFELLRKGRVREAEDLHRSLEGAPSSVASTSLACEIAEAGGDFSRALDIATAALAAHGEDAGLLLKRAQLLLHLRRRREAFATARRAVEAGGTDARLLQAIAKIYLQCNDAAQAQTLLSRAHERRPDDPAILYDMALSHFYLNEPEAAATLLERVLEVAPGKGVALHVRSQLATQTPEKNHIDELRRIVAEPRLRNEDASLANFALAKELEDVGEYEESFRALRRANDLKRSTLDYDVRDDVRAMQNVMANYTGEALARIGSGDQARGPIFIVGMPRTGTTLVERILGSHSETTSIGEAMDFPMEMAALARRAHARSGSIDPDLVRASLSMDFAELGRNYLAAIRQIADSARHTIDKLPFNFRYCGLIHKALPNAAILHLTRNPMDTCYAVFKTAFVNQYHFSYRLDELADYYIAYHRTMDHWHAVIPKVIHDVVYEQLVTDPPGWSRKLLEWCGLPWQDGVLDFHRSAAPSSTASTAQIRKPVYRSSVHSWRNYAKQLQPVLRRLEEAGIVDEDGNPMTLSLAG